MSERTAELEAQVANLRAQLIWNIQRVETRLLFWLDEQGLLSVPWDEVQRRVADSYSGRYGEGS